jgi:hypothetical protein
MDQKYIEQIYNIGYSPVKNNINIQRLIKKEKNIIFKGKRYIDNNKNLTTK